MILLRINERNDNICVTLQEKVTLDNPFYLFEVWSTQAPEDRKYFTAPDISSYPRSYNMFSIKAISSGSPDQANGEFICKHTDFWNYKIYEQDIDGNLDPGATAGIVETGIMRVDIDRPEVIEVEHQNDIILVGN